MCDDRDEVLVAQSYDEFISSCNILLYCTIITLLSDSSYVYDYD